MTGRAEKIENLSESFDRSADESFVVPRTAKTIYFFGGKTETLAAGIRDGGLEPERRRRRWWMGTNSAFFRVSADGKTLVAERTSFDDAGRIICGGGKWKRAESNWTQPERRGFGDAGDQCPGEVLV